MVTSSVYAGNGRKQRLAVGVQAALEQFRCRSTLNYYAEVHNDYLIADMA